MTFQGFLNSVFFNFVALCVITVVVKLIFMPIIAVRRRKRIRAARELETKECKE